ncbi:hypothetical protein JCM10207_007237 [Rhodosporidiobolus poonsookiae]
MPPDHISVTFLGTAAGKPSQTRNVSSLVVKLDSRLWVFDAGEGTQHQFMDPLCKLQMSKVTKIFVTHMHADHVNGLPGLLCTISAGEGSVLPGTEDPRVEEAKELPPTQIYGPSGLRLFLRTTLGLTHSILTRPYAVHELLFPDERTCTQDEGALHPSERAGRDIRMGAEGDWRGFVDEKEGAGVQVSAAPIEHTIRCIGYLLHESARPLPMVPSSYIPHLKRPINAAALAAQGVKNPLSLLSRLQSEREPIELADGTVLRPPELGGEGGRRVVVLGDTFDAETGMGPLLDSPFTSSASFASSSSSDAAQPSIPSPSHADYVDLAIHESTNAFLPTLDDSHSPLKPLPASLQSVTALARSHGHSTPQVAGSFARRARARRLVMNHLSVKYPDPESARLAPGEGVGGASEETRGRWRGMLSEMERQAGRAMRGEAFEPEPAADEVAGAGGGQEGGGEEWTVRTARDFWEVEVPRRDKAAAAKTEGKGGKKGMGKT